jgi:hypothetical protein
MHSNLTVFRCLDPIVYKTMKKGGEIVKRKLSVLITGLALLMVVAAVSPVMACGPRRRLEKIPISTSYTIDTTANPPTAPTKTWTIGDKFKIEWGATLHAQHYVTLHSTPEETLVGTLDIVRFTITNLEITYDTFVLRYIDDIVWTFEGGTFEGKAIWEITRLPEPYKKGDWPTTILYYVLRGTGMFKGQTVVLSYDGPLKSLVWNGFLYKR